MALPDNSQPAASDRNFLLLTAVVTDELQQLELPGSSTSFFFPSGLACSTTFGTTIWLLLCGPLTSLIRHHRSRKWPLVWWRKETLVILTNKAYCKTNGPTKFVERLRMEGKGETSTSSFVPGESRKKKCDWTADTPSSASDRPITTKRSRRRPS